MSKPNALVQLILDLQQEGLETSVTAVKNSHAKVYLTAEADEPIVLSKEECELLLHSAETVKMLAEALAYPPDAAIELHQISIEDDVQDALERTFSTVDES